MIPGPDPIRTPHPERSPELVDIDRRIDALELLVREVANRIGTAFGRIGLAERFMGNLEVDLRQLKEDVKNAIAPAAAEPDGDQALKKRDAGRSDKTKRNP